MAYDIVKHEIIYSEDRTEQIGGLYEAAKDNLTNILADMVPAKWCNEPINPRIEHLYNQLSQLRNHCFDIKENNITNNRTEQHGEVNY